MSDLERIPPSRQALAEALVLSAEIIRNIELSDIPLANIALKASRLARLLNDFKHQQIMEYEAGGYPSGKNGVTHEVWSMGVSTGRVYWDGKGEEANQYMVTISIIQMEQYLKNASSALASAADPDVSVSSANPNQYVTTPAISNRIERNNIIQAQGRYAEILAKSRSFIYQYVLKVHYDLKFSGIAGDIFTRIRERVDGRISTLIPEAVRKLTAVYEGLESDNPENWSNAVHSCRRILQDLADVLYPPTTDKTIAAPNGKPKTIKLGPDNYINRLIAYAEEHSDSERFNEIVGSHLEYLGERLDSIFQAAQKGSHSTIVSREEAERYVVYTYLLVGDLLSLSDGDSKE